MRLYVVPGEQQEPGVLLWGTLWTGDNLGLIPVIVDGKVSSV